MVEQDKVLYIIVTTYPQEIPNQNSTVIWTSKNVRNLAKYSISYIPSHLPPSPQQPLVPINIYITIKYDKALLCYNICWSLLASQLMSNFCPIPDLYAKVPDFYADIFLFMFHCDGNVRGQVPVDCLWSVTNDSARDARTRGEGGFMLLAIFLCECSREIILAWNLLRWTKSQTHILVQPPLPQGNGKVIYVDISGVWPRNCVCDTAVEPTAYV